jgi:hypothetical protein
MQDKPFVISTAIGDVLIHLGGPKARGETLLSLPIIAVVGSNGSIKSNRRSFACGSG